MGDALSALGELYDTYAQRIFRYIYHRLGDQYLASLLEQAVRLGRSTGTAACFFINKSDRENAEKVLRSVEEETVDMVGPALVEATVEWIE